MAAHRLQPGQGRGRGFDPMPEFPANPNDVIQALNGFKVEIVAKADRIKQGSWINITEDDQGRLVFGANEQQPFTRLTLDKSGTVTKTETIFTPVSEAMGITWHDNALYVQGGRLEKPFTETLDNPGFGRQSGQAGLHRLRDPNGDGSFTTVDTLRTWDGGEGGHSDHGIHQARVSPDGKRFYIINGNGVVPPPDVSPDSPLRNYADDCIIPLLGPQTGRLGHEKAPGGTLSVSDFEGKDLHLFAGGMRNALHFDWNADGDIFSFDSDMEPEFGVPWYRPVRVFWMPSGADLGYRGNSGKYPTWYEDSLPPLVEIGLGSPVGVTFGYRTAFPAKYQKALFVADNNYGRIIAVHLKPAGSGYVATSWENFIWPKSLYGATPRMPHNVTDMLVAKDGTFYYVIGSRCTQSYLMKATYVGSLPTARVDYRNPDGAQDRALRRSLETFHWTTQRSEGGRRRVATSRQRGSVPALRRARGARDRIGRLVEGARVCRAGPGHRDDRAAGAGARRRSGGQRRAVRGARPDPALDTVGSAADPEAAGDRSRGQPQRQAVRGGDPEAGCRGRRRLPGILVRVEHRDVADPGGVQRRDGGGEDAAADGAEQNLRGAVRLPLQPAIGDGGVDSRGTADLFPVVQRGPPGRSAPL